MRDKAHSSASQTVADVTQHGAFETVRLLATGGGGTVWLARQLSETEPRFVIKTALPGLEASLRAEWLALHEVSSTVLPEPVQWLAAHQENPPALVMLRRAGQTLDLDLADASPARVASVVQAVLRGLQALHAAGLVHGDLHPGNILVESVDPPRVALLDLGLAVAPGQRVAGVGRLPFAAPDVLRGLPADPRDDLFALAMAVWTSWRLPLPFAHYPAVLPERGAQPTLPRTEDPAREAVMQALARWLAPAREHRPDDAAQAQRQWTSTLRLEAAEAPALAEDLHALAHRPWRWGRWPGMATLPVPLAGQVLWLQGAAGQGHTGALVALAEQARDRGVAVAWLRPVESGDTLATAWLSAQLLEPAQQSIEAAGPAMLADAAGTEVERQGLRLRNLLRALGNQGLLLVDDAGALPIAVQRALAALDPGHAAVVVAGLQAPEGSMTCVLAPPTAEEIDAALKAASGGRGWDAGLVAGLAARALPRREILTWAEAALRADLVEVTADRVALRPGADAVAALAFLAELRGRNTLPDTHLWPLAARVALAGRDGVASDQTVAARYEPLLRVTPGGRVAVADETARAFLVRELPSALLAAAARLRAAQLPPGDPDRAELLTSAAGWDAGPAPGATEIEAAARIWLARGDAARTVDLCRAWLTLGLSPQADVPAACVQALVARGQFDAAETLLAGLGPTERSRPRLRLAEAELAFRAGDYPRCRALAEATLADPGTRAEARLWLGFAATWQGDRQAAAEIVAQARAETQDLAAIRLLDYLAALGDYYAGRLDEAQATFTRLADETTGSLRAAAQGGLGLVAHRRGDLHEARQHYDHARQLAEVAGDLPRALNMAMNAAVLDHEHGDLGRALDGYDHVVRAARALDNPGALARALNNRGNLLALIGDDSAARADLAQALVAMERAGNAYLEGNVRCVLAELDRRAGLLDEAVRQLDLAQAAMQTSGAESEHLETRQERGELQLAAGNLGEARATALAVRVAAARLGSPENEARGLWLLARTRLDVSTAPEPEHLREAAGHLEAALALAPAAKALLHVQLQADAARVAALTGDLGHARTLARESLARLSAVAATLGPARQQAFAHAPRLAAVRGVLQLLAHLAEPGRGAGLQRQAGASALHAVLSINRRLSGEYDLPHLLELVMDSAVLLTGAERGFLLLDEDDPQDPHPQARRKPGSHRLTVAVARNLDRENLRKAAHKLSHGIAMRVFEGGEAVLSTDAQADERFADQASIHAGSLRSIVCVPLAWQGRPIGVVYVDNRFTTGAFSADHAGVLEALADQAAIAIQTARLLQRQRDTTEALAKSRAEVEQLNAQLQVRLAETEHALDDARADLQAQRLALARRSDFSQIKGESPLLHRLFALMERVRDHDFPVLVRGESGTGKELVARAIHFTGRRKKGPFVAVNCAALPANLLESELFGHVRGAFTGAVAERRGLFEAAHAGTLLLDEVGEMPLEMQAKLLRVLQTGEIQRVGDSAVRKVDTRVVAATHRDLPAMVAQGTFREDLMYRLRVVELEVPPLRRRADDIPMLVEHFLAENRKAGVGRVERVAPAALARLREAPWPGNVRQLETVLKSACLFAVGDVLQAADVEPLLQREKAVEPRGEGGDAPDWLANAPLEEVITRVIEARVVTCGGNKRKAAETLGIDRGTLYNRLKTL